MHVATTVCSSSAIRLKRGPTPFWWLFRTCPGLGLAAVLEATPQTIPAVSFDAHPQEQVAVEWTREGGAASPVGDVEIAAFDEAPTGGKPQGDDDGVGCDEGLADQRSCSRRRW